MKTITTTMFCLASLGAFASPAFANNAAEIATEQYCQCTTCAIELGSPLLTTMDARAVATSSGNVTYQCHFDIPEGYEPSRALHPESPGCTTPFGPANKSHITLSPGGKATLTCQVNPSGL